ncbi:MAG: DUF4102 domain-containing protein [Oxalobacteraceae bacterium]|nr:MAG: DUF4102 domain-containing protein [Oxalobacteraceae bacterium]
MPRVKLDAAFCAAASCPPDKKRIDYYDTSGTTGFVLECRSSGAKTYVLRFSDEAGTQKQIKIGSYGDITFDQARKKARQLKAEIVLGDDPTSRKKAKKAIPLYRELAEQHRTHAQNHLRRPSNVESVLDNHLLPKWGKLRLDEIKTQDIAKWLAEKAREGMAPATIEKIRVTLNRSFELGGQWEMPGAVPNPVKHVPRRKVDNARDRYLTTAEAQRLLKAVEESENPQLKHIVGLLLLTGCRKMELLQAKWENVDVERQTLFLPITKNGHSRHVPLSREAIAIIETLPRFENCPWLLPNPKTRKPYTDIKRAWTTARNSAGLESVRIHDLRHTSASMMINAGIDLFAVGKVLGHRNSESTSRYSHLSNYTLLHAVESGSSNLNIKWSEGAAS